MTVDKQILLELQIKQSSHDKQSRKIQKSIQNGTESQLEPVQCLLKHSLIDVSKAFKELREKALSGRGGHNQISFMLVKGIPETVVVESALKALFNTVSSVSAIQPVCIKIGTAIEDSVRDYIFKTQNPSYFNKIQEDLNSRTQNEKHRRAVVRKAFNSSLSVQLDWSVEERFKLGLKMVDIISSVTGYVHLKRSSVTDTYNVTPSEDLWRWLCKAYASKKFIKYEHQPMLCKPNDWTTFSDGGYLVNQLDLIKVWNRKPYIDMSFEKYPEVFDCINSLQGTAWRICKPVFEVLEQSYKAGGGIANLPKSDMEEPPAKPFIPDQYKKLKAKDMPDPYKTQMIEWRQLTAKHYNKEQEEINKRYKLSRTIAMAEKFLDDDFYFVHQYDFRGRIYPVQKYLNHQTGGDISRGLLEFSQGKEVTSEEEMDCLRIHGANVYGLDKHTYSYRLEWVKGMHDAILSISRDPFQNKQWTNADEPWQFLAFCFEYSKYLVNGLPFVSHIPVSSDATCSGLQHLAAMTGDMEVGSMVNLVPSEARQDIYQVVAEQVNDVLKLRNDQIAIHWRNKVDRGLVKENVMTVPYSVTYDGMVRQLKQSISGHRNGAELLPKDVIDHSHYLAKISKEVIDSLLIKPLAAQRYMKAVTRMNNAQGNIMQWETPTGFPVRMENNKPILKRIQSFLDSLGDDKKRITTKVTIANEPKIDSEKQLSSISANVVQSMDAALLMRTVSKCRSLGVTGFHMVHDSFGTHVADKVAMDKCIRESFYELYSTFDVLRELRKDLEEIKKYQLQGIDIPSLVKKGDLDLSGVIESDYFFS